MASTSSGSSGRLGHFCLTTIVGLATGASAWASSSCQFVKVNDISRIGDVFGNLVDATDIGIYRFQVTEPNELACDEYPNWFPYSTSFTVAQAAGPAAVCFYIFAFGLLLFEFLCCKVAGNKVFIGGSLVLGSICQGLTFMMFNTDFCNIPFTNDNNCTLGDGAISSIVACSVCFLSSCAVFLMPNVKSLYCRSDDEDRNIEDDEAAAIIDEENPEESLHEDEYLLEELEEEDEAGEGEEEAETEEAFEEEEEGETEQLEDEQQEEEPYAENEQPEEQAAEDDGAGEETVPEETAAESDIVEEEHATSVAATSVAAVGTEETVKAGSVQARAALFESGRV